MQHILISLRILRNRINNTPWPLAVAIAMMIYFAQHPEWHRDLIEYRSQIWSLPYPYWAWWLFRLLAIPPEIIAFIILSTVSIVALYFSVKIFHGQMWKIFVSFPFAWTLFYGQVDSLVIGGLAIAWWALKTKRPVLIGLGIAIAMIKPQLSLPLSIAFWWWSTSRSKSSIFPLMMLGTSFLVWGFWIPEWLYKLNNSNTLVAFPRNMSLWPLIGFFGVIFWIPLMLISLPRDLKVMAIAAMTAMTVPYFPLPSFGLLLVMPTPAGIWMLANLPAFGSLIGYGIYNWMKIIPPLVLLWILWRSHFSASSGHNEQYLY